MQKEKRVVSDDDVMRYKALVNKYLRDYVVRNWRDASMSPKNDRVILGSTGMTMADMRQQLMMEVVVALQKYNPDYRTPEGRSVSELTFVYTHLFNRVGQMMKRLTHRRCGYGVYHPQFESVYFEDKSTPKE